MKWFHRREERVSRGEAVETVNWMVQEEGRRMERWGGWESIWGKGKERAERGRRGGKEGRGRKAGKKKMRGGYCGLERSGNVGYFCTKSNPESFPSTPTSTPKSIEVLCS